MKKYLPFIIFLVLEIVVSILPIPMKWVKIVLLVLILLAFSWYRRNVFFYLHANSLLRAGKKEKAWKWFDRALKAKIAPDGVVSIASFHIQYGDEEKGLTVLKDFLNDQKKGASDSLVFLARMLLALVDYKNGKKEQGIKAIEEVHKEGFSSTTLAIDMMTMYLDEDRIDDAEAIWKEYQGQFGKDIALDACYGRLLMRQGKWDTAYSLFATLTQNRIRIANVFIHAAQTSLHYGKVKEAVDRLYVALHCTFNNINTFSRGRVMELYEGLKEPKTRLQYAHAMDEQHERIAKGELPVLQANSYPPCQDDQLEGFAKIAQKVKKAEKDDRIPDTSLDESDETYLEKHPELEK